MGRQLVPLLVARGHRVRALVRRSSVARIPSGAITVIGDALNVESIAAAMQPADTVVHLVGTPHPNPSKAKEFQQVDLPSIRATVEAAEQKKIAHLVYVSVAQPAPVMRAYQAVRSQGEALNRDARLTATIIRPWYVLGPGHWWPYVLLPVYKLLEAIPVARSSAERLGLVTRKQMLRALAYAVEHPPERGAIRIIDVPGIRCAPPL